GVGLSHFNVSVADRTAPLLTKAIFSLTGLAAVAHAASVIVTLETARMEPAPTPISYSSPSTSNVRRPCESDFCEAWRTLPSAMCTLVTGTSAPGVYIFGDVMLSLTPATTGPPGRHSRTDVRSPARETLASDVSPGLRRLDSTSQPHIPKLGYGSVKVKTSGLGSGSVNAFRWKSK